MGYTENCHPQPKADFIAERLRGWDNTSSAGRTLKHSLRGSHLWKLVEVTEKKSGKTEKYIALDLIGCRAGCWGYKDICESMGPYETDCPLTWFDEVPVPSGEYAQGWRDRCRSAVGVKNQLRAFVARLEIGQTVKLKENCSIPEVEITHLKKLRGIYRGTFYSIPTRMIDMEKTLAISAKVSRVAKALDRLEALAA